MRIAQIAPLTERIPPVYYGGTERVVSYLTEELVNRSHEVTLFASGDSLTNAKLIRCCERGLRLDTRIIDQQPSHTLLLNIVCQQAHNFDILHFHTNFIHFQMISNLNLRSVTTVHKNLDYYDYKWFFEHFYDIPIVSVSNSQRDNFPWINWVDTVYHGLPNNFLKSHKNPSLDYLAFLGRICPWKGPHSAISIASQAGVKLKIAAKIDNSQKEYYTHEIKPRLKNKKIEFLGEIQDDEKQEFLGNALALLFPIDWPEPFGLVMIEAMACGTPVIAYRKGSTEEIVEDGVTGFIVENEEQAIKSLKKAKELDREEIRKRFEKRFTACKMTEKYELIYKNIWNNNEYYKKRRRRQKS